ncbi:deoxyribonuclease IV [Patescibacteria group bacterium]|nr:MAG: deoxyribonuclease IV [Patescibacteria group bacterium]
MTMHIGCHVSIVGGVQNAPERAAALGAEVMQIFTRSPQGGKAPELTADIIQEFKAQVAKHKLQGIYVHTPYYINFASGNNRIRYGSVSVVRDELERASLLGAKYVMTHLGSGKDLGRAGAIQKTVEMLDKTLTGYIGSTKLLIENSAGAGEIIGDTLEEIAEIIRLVGSSTIAGICLDTQHSFASGYDWRDFTETIQRVDSELGIDKIKLMHANDSQTELGSKKDRHEHIGEGKIGSEAFRNIVTFAKQHDIDMLCETEHDRVVEDMQLLAKMRD